MRNYFLFISVLLFSCTSTKHIDRTVTVTDSTAVHQVDSLIRLQKLDSAGYQNIIQALSEQQISFRDTGTTKIIYDTVGQIKYIEGPVRYINAKLVNTDSKNKFHISSSDSVSIFSERDSIQVKTGTKTVTVEKKVRFIPWWIWVIIGLLVVYVLYMEGAIDLNKRNPLKK